MVDTIEDAFRRGYRDEVHSDGGIESLQVMTPYSPDEREQLHAWLMGTDAAATDRRKGGLRINPLAPVDLLERVHEYMGK